MPGSKQLIMAEPVKVKEGRDSLDSFDSDILMRDRNVSIKEVDVLKDF